MVVGVCVISHSWTSPSNWRGKGLIILAGWSRLERQRQGQPLSCFLTATKFCNPSHPVSFLRYLKTFPLFWFQSEIPVNLEVLPCLNISWSKLRIYESAVSWLTHISGCPEILLRFFNKKSLFRFFKKAYCMVTQSKLTFITVNRLETRSLAFYGRKFTCVERIPTFVVVDWRAVETA